MAEGRQLEILYLYRDSPLRRKALRQPAGSAQRYLLFGMDQHAERGARVRHNLERPGSPPAWASVLGRGANALVARSGGYGGDFAGVLPSLGAADGADVVFSTVDTVGLPLVLLRWARLVRTPIVYAAVGLPERLRRLRGRRVERVYTEALGSVAAIVAYSEHEAADLEAWLRERGKNPCVVFCPFGVDTEYFRPPEASPTVDVVSVGADPYRDFDLLLDAAAGMPLTKFLIVTTADRRQALGRLPENVTVETDVAFELVRERLASARVVCLPVRLNTYSGATTVLLQSLALGKPVVVSRIPAIATGYGLEDGDSCVFVEPGDGGALEAALSRLLMDPDAAAALGARGRHTVCELLSWERYAERIFELLREAADLTGRRSGAG
jgi:glycosyltransferase involved in cell wall biosynthesis